MPCGNRLSSRTLSWNCNHSSQKVLYEWKSKDADYTMKKAILLFWACLAISVTGCGQSGNTQSQTLAPQNSANGQVVVPDAAGIETITVKTTTVPDYIDLPAQILAEPTRVVHVFPPAGGRIIEMKVHPWDRVEKGQALATIESSDLARAVADYHKAQADYQVKQEQLTRSDDLLAHNAIAMKDYQWAQADAQSAHAELEAAKEQVRVFGMDPDKASTELVVSAPRSGVILDVGAAPGEYSNALSAPQPLCTIADLTTVWAVGAVYEGQLASVKTGQPAQVMLNAYPDQKWTGRAGVVSDAVDPNTRTLQLRVVLANPGGKLKPSMFGTIRLERSSRQGIVLPAAAVLREGNAAYVFVRQGQDRYERRNITPGQTIDGSIEIASGLNVGDTVVSQGALLLRSAASGS